MCKYRKLFCFDLCDIVWTGADGNAADMFLRFEHSSSMSRQGRKAGSMSGVLGCVGVRSLSKNKYGTCCIYEVPRKGNALGVI